MSSDGESAGTYVKLQDAYFSEQNKYGGWGMIGYNAPGQGSSTSFLGNTFTYKAEGNFGWNSEDTDAHTNAWVAQNTQTALNDCAKDNKWTISLKAATNQVTEYTVAAPTSADCQVLTPSFEKIGK